MPVQAKAEAAMIVVDNLNKHFIRQERSPAPTVTDIARLLGLMKKSRSW
jgi:hypothetical protein